MRKIIWQFTLASYCARPRHKLILKLKMQNIKLFKKKEPQRMWSNNNIQKKLHNSPETYPFRHPLYIPQ